MSIWEFWVSIWEFWVTLIDFNWFQSLMLAKLLWVLSAFEYEKNKEINNLENENSRQKGFHAGTKTQEGKVLSNGGRVLCVTALGSTLLDSKNLAYLKVKTIDWKEGFYRDDIGDKAIKSWTAL